VALGGILATLLFAEFGRIAGNMWDDGITSPRYPPSEDDVAQGDSENRATIFIVVAVLGAAVATYILTQIVSGYENQITRAEVEEEEDTIAAIVAQRDLFPGVTITEDDFFMVKIPKDYLPKTFDSEGTPSIADIFYAPERIIGQIPRERILANEIIRNERLANGEAGVGLNAIIPRGMRALSIDLKNAAMLSGFLQPGNYVDVLVTIEPDTRDSEPITKPLLQAVFVLGVNSRMTNESADDVKNRGRQRTSVTLLVSPEQATDIARADEMGDLYLTLRNDKDIVHAEVEGVDIDKLRGIIKNPPRVRKAAATPAAPQVEGPKTILFIRGDKATEETIPK
jgi:pilus assembly protein CpaB